MNKDMLYRFYSLFQGVVIDVSKRNYVTDSVNSEESNDSSEHVPPSLWLVLSSVHDPMNFGGILRTAYFLGTEKIVAYNSCVLSPVVSKASAGAMELFDIYQTNDLHKFVSEQKEKGKFVFGSVGKSGQNTDSENDAQTSKTVGLSETALTKDSLLLIGKSTEINNVNDINLIRPPLGGISLTLF